MGRIIVYIGFCLAILSLNGCDFGRPSEIPLSQGIKTEQSELPAFTSVAIDGPFDVDFRFIPQQYYIHFRGNLALVNQASYFVKDQTLHVVAGKEYSYDAYNKVLVTIEVPYITGLSYRGPGKINIKDLDAPSLALDMAGSGFAVLTGRANRFDAVLTGTSRMDAKCFYSKIAFVNASDSTQAEVASNENLSSLAAVDSDVYYYESPQMVAKYENHTGSVMRMKGIAEANPEPAIPVPRMQTEPGAVMEYSGGK